MTRFLEEHPIEKAKLDIVKNRLKYDSYMWNYGRLTADKAEIFIVAASQEFKKDMLNGVCVKEAYPWYKWNNLNAIIDNPLEFHKREQREKSKKAPMSEAEYIELKKQNIFKRGRKCLKENGWRYTIKRMFRIGRRSR